MARRSVNFEALRDVAVRPSPSRRARPFFYCISLMSSLISLERKKKLSSTRWCVCVCVSPRNERVLLKQQRNQKKTDYSIYFNTFKNRIVVFLVRFVWLPAFFFSSVVADNHYLELLFFFKFFSWMKLPGITTSGMFVIGSDLIIVRIMQIAASIWSSRHSNHRNLGRWHPALVNDKHRGTRGVCVGGSRGGISIRRPESIVFSLLIF